LLSSFITVDDSVLETFNAKLELLVFSVAVTHQVAVLLQRASILWQSTSAWDDDDLWSYAVEVRLPDYAQTTAGQVSCREGQNAAGKADTGPHTFSTVAVW